MINNKKSTPASNLVKFVKNNYYGLFERKSLGSSVAKSEGNIFLHWTIENYNFHNYI